MTTEYRQSKDSAGPLVDPEYMGAMSLIRDCVGGQAGERLCIVNEAEHSGFYDEQAPKQAAAAGRALGMIVFELQFHSFVNDEKEKNLLLNSLKGFDHIVFFSRVGDQIRFSGNEALPSSTMCYTLNRESLNSSFGTACYRGMQEIKLALDHALELATDIRVTCPRGSDFSGRPDWGSSEPTDVTIKRFPLSVPRPITANGMHGRIALSRFLVGTGSRYYEPYCLPLPTDVFAYVANGRITRFEGNRLDVDRVEQHYKQVSEKFSIDPWCVDSWHAGIHPACQFETNAEADILRWCGTAFGNPRILHFHTCGNYAPGEISWTVLDPTVYIDGIPVWDNGVLHPERLHDGANILQRHPNLAKLFKSPAREIGFS